jgi:pSer/pThr/pTyr-binding forkhead associated (FHA) protein
MDVQLIVEKGPARIHAIKLRGSETLVGRQKGCNVRIPSAEVSRRHCLLRFAEGKLSIEDLNSANGTFLNDAPIKGKRVVEPGDRLRIGPITFAVEYEPMQVVKDASRHPPKANEPEPAFELIDDDADTAEGPIPLQKTAEESIELVFDDSEPLDLPDGEDLRDLLNKMDH